MQIEHAAKTVSVADVEATSTAKQLKVLLSKQFLHCPFYLLAFILYLIPFLLNLTYIFASFDLNISEYYAFTNDFPTGSCLI